MMRSQNGLRAALVCTSLGYSKRGFERFTSELYDLLKGDMDIELFGCYGGEACEGRRLPCLKNDRSLSFLRGRAHGNYYFQQLSYAAFFIPWVMLRGYDLVHCSEPALANFLFHTKKRLGLRFKLLFTDALGLDPVSDKVFFERLDHVQVLTPEHEARLLSAGIQRKKFTRIPYGADSGRYDRRNERALFREKYGVPADSFVVVSVAALNRRHKRVDFLIEEVSRLGEDVFLFVAGNHEDASLLDLGKNKLGKRFKAVQVPQGQMSEIYPIGDVFVIPSLVEGFCLAVVEAMCAGVPVIAHDSPHFEWLIGDRRCLADLSVKGNLAKKINEVRRQPQIFADIASVLRQGAAERFDWKQLKSRYQELYERAFRS